MCCDRWRFYLRKLWAGSIGANAFCLSDLAKVVYSKANLLDAACLYCAIKAKR
jgi:hypothetical protein